MRLADIIKRSSSPLIPESTGAEPLLPNLPDIRAIVFDVYGTLFISESGDISLAEESDREDLMRQAFSLCGIGPARDDIRLVDRFHQTIHGFQDNRREQGIAWPEVEIREVWQALLDRLIAENVIDGASPSPSRLEELAVTYECLSNRIWPMPGLRETLSAIRERGLLLGIVSNAQFYTPLLFEGSLTPRSRNSGLPRVVASGPTASAKANPRQPSTKNWPRRFRQKASHRNRPSTWATTSATTSARPSSPASKPPSSPATNAPSASGRTIRTAWRSLQMAFSLSWRKFCTWPARITCPTWL